MREKARWLPVLAALLTSALPTWSQQAPAPEIAAVAVSPQGITWQPLVEHARFVLTVAGPGIGVLRRELAAGEVPSLDLFDARGARLPDGSYTWELLAIPELDPQVRALLEALRASSSPIAGTKLLPGTVRPPRQAQAGYFSVRDGSIVVPALEGQSGGIGQATAPAATNVTAPDSTVPDDLIAQGSACVGIDCANGESFGDTVLKLKATVVRLELNDTSTAAGFPANDWRITANDSASGGADRFSLDDVTGGKTPFTLEAGAPSHSLYVDDAGRVGFGTATPATDLHVTSGGTPALRLEQDGSGGLTPQSWDVAGDESGFFVRDLTNGARVPLRIRPAAPTGSLEVAANGDVGVGTAAPAEKLHVFENADSNSFIMIENPSAGLSAAGVLRAKSDVTTVNFQAHGSGRTIARFGQTLGGWAEFLQVNGNGLIVGTSTAKPLILGTAAVSRIHVAGDGKVGLGTATPAHPLHMASGAHVTAGGVWTDASSRELKERIEDLSTAEAEAALAGLEPVKFRYKAAPEEGYVGFLAEEVPELVATADRQGLSPMDIVAVLTKVVQEQQKALEEQREEIRRLAQEVEALREQP